MHPFETPDPGPPPGVSDHLSVTLKAGWRFDRRRRRLVSEGGESVRLAGLLPRGAKVLPVAPALAAADPAGLSADEQYLARLLQVVVPSGADAAGVDAALRGADGVEKVTTPPRIALP
jgi:hypothetical protein